MGKGVNLKLGIEEALALLAHEADHAIDRVRAAAVEAAEEMQQANKLLRSGYPPPQGAPLVEVMRSEVAVLIDFNVNSDMTNYRLPLNLGIGSEGGYVDLPKGLARGRYRAMVFINPLPEAKAGEA